MTTGALIFMLASWALVIGLMAWSFRRILQMRRHHDPDGIGPAAPPEPSRTEREGAVPGTPQ